ncbi:pentalenene synthase [Kitasatospora sp. NPDC097605]|uniref:terpene synthase family protein n=1 Tax=Kitasatospora sp. NPDC097605 TaxID=3157226 RepID=UPI003328E118
MPQDVEFALPWPLRSSPHLPRARAHSLAWLGEYGLLDGRTFTAAEFDDWKLAELAAFFFPDATGEGLELAGDLMGWYFAPFDDRFDGPLGRLPRQAAAVCEELAAVLVVNADADAGAAPVAVRGLADIWRRSCRGMSEAWRVRAAHDWRAYLAAHLAETVDRHHGRVMGAEECVRRRALSTSSFVVIDMIERVGGFEVPALVWHTPVLAELRGLTAEVIGLSNDLCSAEKEEAAGDVRNNVVLVLQRERGCGRAEAVEEVVGAITERVARFVAVEERMADLDCVLTEGGAADVRRLVTGLHGLIRGDYAWERMSGRYRAGRHRADRAR